MRVYIVFFGMHFLGLGGMPRRYYAFTEFQFLQEFQGVNVFITICAFILGAVQFLFLFNFFWSLWKGPQAEKNPWKATTLEWEAPSPPPHGNWGASVPTVHRWAYEYSLLGDPQDYTPQTTPPGTGGVTQ